MGAARHPRPVPKNPKKGTPKVDPRNMDREQFLEKIGHRFSRCHEPARHAPHPWRALDPTGSHDYGWYWCGGEPTTKYGVRGPDPRNTVVAFPDRSSAMDARVGDDVVVASNDGGRHWSTLEQHSTNRRCGCCGPMDMGICSCATFCGSIRCSRVGEAESIVGSPLAVLVRHQLRRTGDDPGQVACQCGASFDVSSTVQQARHVVDQLVLAGFTIVHKDGYTGKPLDLANGDRSR